MPTETVTQRHSGKGSNILNNSLNQKGKKIINTFDQKVFFGYSEELAPEDEEYKNRINKARIKEYRNLLDRIEFHCNLREYETAKKLVTEANKILHNSHTLLSYNAISCYATSTVSELISENHTVEVIINLIEKSKELKSDSKISISHARAISQSFYDLIGNDIEKLLEEARVFKIRRQYPKKAFYSAIAHYLVKLESCYRIHNDTSYLKEAIFHYSGYRDYAWFKLIENQEIDLGMSIFENGAAYKLDQLILQIKTIEPDYTPPEKKYGDYLDVPKKKASRRKFSKNIISFLLMILTIIFVSIPVFYFFEIEYTKYMIIVFAMIIIHFISKSRGKEKASIIESLASSLLKILDKSFKSK